MGKVTYADAIMIVWTIFVCVPCTVDIINFVGCSWGQWNDIVQRGNFLKRNLSTRDVESIARTIVSREMSDASILNMIMFIYILHLCFYPASLSTV